MLKNRIKIFIFAMACILLVSSCGGGDNITDKPRVISSLTFNERVELDYADQLTIDRYDGGYSLISTPEASYLIVPEGSDAPEGLDGDIKIIKHPLNNVYLAATAAMSFFDALGSVDAIRFSGTKAEDWYIDSAREALENGSMLYAGKYREPDYELLLSEGCPLSVQSTMIGHSPDVKEKLEELGVTVFVDYSSYETHPIGRCEWIKAYGEMLGKSDDANRLFDEQAAYLTSLRTEETGKTVAFFYINSASQPVTRKSGDYITKMIEIAGGENVFKNLGADSSSATVTLETEQFYSAAKDADIIIYNSTIGGEINSLDNLTSKNSLLADFKAVREGNVWCTKKNLYQETMSMGAVISDFNAIFTGNTDNSPPKFLYRAEEGGAVE